MKGRSLRVRLTIWSGLITAAALLLFGGAFAFFFYLRQLHTLDSQLGIDSHVFFLALGEPGAAGAGEAQDARPLLRGSARILGYAFGRKGEAPSHEYPASRAALFAAWPRTPGFTSVDYHQSHARVAVFEEGGRWLMLVADLHSTETLTTQALGVYLLALPLVLLAVVLGNARIVQLALRPVTELTEAATQITTRRLDARIPQPAVEDEIGRHVRVLNEMFDRLERGFAQATRFTADASHELRLPLTILRGEIEEALRSGAGEEAQEDLLLSLLGQVDQLQRISSNLLLLAGLDAGKSWQDRAPVALNDLATEAVETAELLGTSRQLTVLAGDLAPVQVPGDATLLRRCLLNLVENAVAYNRPGGTIRIGLAPPDSAGFTRFTIANTGKGIPSDSAPRLFQRFFRAAADRNRASGGAGLGLSLCREIVAFHAGNIALTGSGADFTEFTVRLPVNP